MQFFFRSAPEGFSKPFSMLMGRIRIQDITICNLASSCDSAVLFKEKIEIAKLLDRLGVDVITLPLWSASRADSLLVKAVAMDVKKSVLSVPVPLDVSGLAELWDALKTAAKPRLAVQCMSSSVGMEYLQRKKEAQMAQAVSHAVGECAKLTKDVEFVILDASRADEAFLARIADEAIQSGATTITLCDTAGLMLPHEVDPRKQSFLSRLTAFDSGKVSLGVCFSDASDLGSALSYYAAKSGFDEIVVSSVRGDVPFLPGVAGLIAAHDAELSGSFGLDASNMHSISSKIERICSDADEGHASIRYGSNDDEDDSLFLTINDSRQVVGELARKLGYDLTSDDLARVYEAVQRNARSRRRLGAKEFESILANESMQVPATYALRDYVYTSGASSRSMSHITLEKSGRVFEGIAVGDGPIDASFMAIGKIAGQRYELDDFMIRSITEGQEALGETLVKLRYNGKLYSGCGISADIVASSIRAYIMALNKITWEEEGSGRK